MARFDKKKNVRSWNFIAEKFKFFCSSFPSFGIKNKNVRYFDHTFFFNFELKAFILITNSCVTKNFHLEIVWY